MHITQRKEFYYLSHTFRKGSTVVHREHYLGKEIPTAIESVKEAFLRRCLHEDAFKKLACIKKNFKKEWATYPESVKKELLVTLSVDFTYNTNAIEGSPITHEETEDIIKRKISPHKPLNDVQETVAHSHVFFKVLNETRKFSLPLLLEWHRELFSQTKLDIAGKIRDYLVRVGPYLAPDWQELRELLKEFFAWYSMSLNNMHPIELAARAHYQFEKIHPFGDGNGRVGRLIIAHTLKNAGYPLLIIEYKKRKHYYHALQKSEHDFLLYFIRRYIAVHKRYIKKT